MHIIKKVKFPVCIVLFFVLGVGVCLYPGIARYINAKNEGRVIETMKKDIQKISTEDIEKEKEAVRNYNSRLLNGAVVLLDPFKGNPSHFRDTDYEKLLSFSEAMACIKIEKINVDLPVYHGTEKEILQKGVGHVRNTSLPMGGAGTHVVLSAHTGLPSKKLFGDLNKLEIGDVFNIHVLDEDLSYQVDKIKTVSPDDASDLSIEREEDYVTLMTCTPYAKNTHRLLVRGKRIPNECAEKILEDQAQKASFLDKLLRDFGISFEEMIVFLCVMLLCAVFICVILFKKNGKH